MTTPSQAPIAITINHRVSEHIRAERLHYAKRSRFDCPSSQPDPTAFDAARSQRSGNSGP